MKLTRRELAAALVPVAALAQTPSPATPADELKGAEARLQANSDALTRLSVPIETEPSFQFHA